jgi:hypothetical protein
VKCRRPYDLKRHKQTKHDQSEHWFCPADSCKLSCSPAGLLKELCSTCFKVEFLGYFRSPLTSKVLHSDQRNGYEKYELNGFPRRDKLIKHLKKDHKVSAFHPEVILLNADASRRNSFRFGLQSLAKKSCKRSLSSARLSYSGHTTTDILLGSSTNGIKLPYIICKWTESGQSMMV